MYNKKILDSVFVISRIIKVILIILDVTKTSSSNCLLLDVLGCSIAAYFYESRSILVNPKGELKYKWRVKIYSDTTH